MRHLRTRLLWSSLLLLLANAALTVRSVLADVDVVIGYETRAIGELDECG